MGIHEFIDTFQVLSANLVEKVKGLIHEGNVQRIIIKDEHGRTFIEIPVAVAALGAIVSPVLAAVGALSAVANKFTIEVQRHAPASQETHV